MLFLTCGLVHNLEVLRTCAGERETLMKRSDLPNVAKVRCDRNSCLTPACFKISRPLMSTLQFWLCDMGVAELLSWGVPPILVLLHLVLVHHRDCPDDQVWCLFKPSNMKVGLLICFLNRRLTSQNFSVVKLR